MNYFIITSFLVEKPTSVCYFICWNQKYKAHCLTSVCSWSWIRASLIAQLVKNLPAMQETPVRFRICWIRDSLPTALFLGFPCGLAGEGSVYNAGGLGLIPGLGDNLPTAVFLGFPCGSVGKRICLQCGRPRFDSLVGKIPWRRKGLPSPVYFLEESM